MSVAPAPAAKRPAPAKSQSLPPVAKKRRKLPRRNRTTRTSSPQPVPPAATQMPSYAIPDLQTLLAAHDNIRGIHPACEALPLIDGECFDSLCRAIAKSGLLEPIRLDEAGRIVDGRCRLLACHAVGVEPRFVTTTDDPWAIAMSNVARRFLSVGQRAVIAIRIAAAEKADAEKRKKATLRQGKTPNVSQPDGKRGKATAIAAKRFGISADSVEKAAKLPAELQERVMAKQLSLHAASKQADAQSGKTKPAGPTTPKTSESHATSPTSADEEFPTLFRSKRIWVVGHRDSRHQGVIVGPTEERFSPDWNVQVTNDTRTYHFGESCDAQNKLHELLREIVVKTEEKRAKRSPRGKKKAESAA